MIIFICAFIILNLVIAILWETYSEIIAVENEQKKAEESDLEFEDDASEDESEKEPLHVVHVPI